MRKLEYNDLKVLVSNKAINGYNDTDPLTVYSEQANGSTTYTIKDSDGTHKGLTLKQLNEYLEFWGSFEEE